MKTCQSCNAILTAADLTADPYTSLCQQCWDVWRIEAGSPLVRYGQPGTVCAACGMGFGGVTGFDRHRMGGRCLSPAELKAQNRPLSLKGGIWVDAYRGNAKISPGGWPASDFADKTISTPHPAAGVAVQALPCGSGAIRMGDRS
jgi:hypothetical protein